MFGLFSGNIKIEDAKDFFSTKSIPFNVKKVNESKNIIKGCNILKILNKIVIVVEYVKNK